MVTCDECGCPFECHGDRAIGGCSGSIVPADMTHGVPLKLLRDVRMENPPRRPVCPCPGFRLPAPVEDEDRSILERAKSLLVGAR